MITIDFETEYDSEYSLTKLTTEQYVRSPRFNILGVGIKVGAQPTEYLFGRRDQLKGVLAGYSWGREAVLAHNSFFDIAILNWIFDIRPKFVLDTMLMARPKHAANVGVSLDALCDYYSLGRKTNLDFKGWLLDSISPEQHTQLGGYCTNDVEITYKLYNVLKVGFPLTELAVIDRIVRMYTEPKFGLDTKYLQTIVDGGNTEKEEAMSNLRRVLGYTALTEKELASNEKFAEILENKLKYKCPVKRSPSDYNKWIPALAKTDDGFKELLTSDDAAVRLLAQTRLEIKSVLGRTRALRLIDVATRGLLPIMLHYYGAHTGRFSGGEKLNLQNLPRDGRLRKALLAPPGYVVIAADSSQIEARLTAWLADQLDLLKQFKNYDADKTLHPSPYEVFASTIYKRTITGADKKERFVGKTCILGLGYGMGGLKLQNTLRVGQGGISLDLSSNECFDIVNLYRSHHQKIVKLWDEGDQVLKAINSGNKYSLKSKIDVDAEGMHLPNGMKLTYYGLEQIGKLQGSMFNWGYIDIPKSVALITLAKIKGERHEKYMRNIYGAKVIENLIQALARIVVTEQMLILSRRYHIALQVHDENVGIVKEEEADEAAKYFKEVMSTPPVWAPTLPINCEVGVGHSYGDC